MSEPRNGRDVCMELSRIALESPAHCIKHVYLGSDMNTSVVIVCVAWKGSRVSCLSWQISARDFLSTVACQIDCTGHWLGEVPFEVMGDIDGL